MVRKTIWLCALLLGGFLVVLNMGKRRPYQSQEEKARGIVTELEEKLNELVRNDADLQNYTLEIFDVLDVHHAHRAGKETQDKVTKELQGFVGLLKDDGIQQQKVDTVERMLLGIVNS